MSFVSVGFVALLCITLPIYYAVPQCLKKPILLLASFAFYAFDGYLGIAVICLITFVSFFSSAAAEASHSNRTRGFVTAVGTVAVLSAPISMKIACIGGSCVFDMPLGVSFYSLQAASYIMDVHRKRAAPVRNILKLALFISYFPQLVQGPISRYGDLSEQFDIAGRPSWSNILLGILRMSWGYFKKLAVSDVLAVTVHSLLDNADTYRGAGTLLLTVLYSIRLYADFTGGADIALGASELFGIHLAENFDRPFSSMSVREYWNRWHITLGAWFTDHIFYPLSVSRPLLCAAKGARQRFGDALGRRLPLYSATAVTWVLTGLWHGLGANYLVWGLTNCAIMLASQECQPLYRSFRSRFSRITGSQAWTLLSRTRTFFIVGALRLLDVYRSPALTWRRLVGIFSDFGMISSVIPLVKPLITTAVAPSLVLFGVIGALERDGKKQFLSRIRMLCERRPLFILSLIATVLLCTAVFGSYGIGYSASDFIYSEF